MHLRRTLLAASLAGALTAVVPATTAGASAATLRCTSYLFGFDSAQRHVQRTVQNAAVVEEKKAAAAVPFAPTSMSYLDGATVDGTVRSTLTTLDGEGAPRTVKVQGQAGDPALTVTTKRMFRPAGPRARLLADSSGRWDYIVDRAGNLKRWELWLDRGTGLFFWDNPVLLSTGMGRLKTLGFQSRLTIGGVKKDVLWGTTKTGALLQLQIPIARPKALKVTRVKRTGFRQVKGLSTGVCQDRPSMASLVVIEPGLNRARWITIRDQATPKPRNLVNHGRVAGNLNWRLHATF